MENKKQCKLCCAGHVALTMHAGINKCTGVTADHVGKHLGGVCACIYAGIFMCACVCVSGGRAGRPQPPDHHKIKPGPLIHRTWEYKTSFTEDKNKHDKVTVWSF